MLQHVFLEITRTLALHVGHTKFVPETQFEEKHHCEELCQAS